jgi:hypothetical protein
VIVVVIFDALKKSMFNIIWQMTCQGEVGLKWGCGGVGGNQDILVVDT